MIERLSPGPPGESPGRPRRLRPGRAGWLAGLLSFRLEFSSPRSGLDFGFWLSSNRISDWISAWIWLDLIWLDLIWILI